MKELPEAFESVLGIVKEGKTFLVEIVFRDDGEWYYQIDGCIADVLDWFPIPEEIRERIKEMY